MLFVRVGKRNVMNIRLIEYPTHGRRRCTGALIYLFAAALSIGRVWSADTNDLTVNLQKGLFEEEANHNYPAAIQAYQVVIDRFDEERKLGATAIFRLSEVYRKQGRTNEANELAQRIVREFPDQSALANLSQGYLSAAGLRKPGTNLKDETATGDVTSEVLEINRMRAMIKDSPDLINARDREGRTPLHVAATEGQLSVAQFLLGSGADVQARNSVQATPLQLAANAGHKGLVELFLQKGARVDAVNSSDMTALHFAAIKGYLSIVESLVNHKADVNAKDSKGATPLHGAVGNGFKAIAEFLLEHGADPNLDCTEVFQPFGQQVPGVPRLAGTPLDIAVGRADQAMVGLLLAHHAGPNIPSRALSEEVPLHIAAQNGNEEAAAALLNAGAKPDPVNNENKTPLDLAASKGQRSVAALLVSHGAEVNRRNAGRQFAGWTPLHWAVTSGRKDIVQFLVEKGAEVNAQLESDPGPYRFQRGTTPLLVATTQAEPEIVEVLLDHKADPNVPNVNGITPINMAIKTSEVAKRQRMVAALLDNGADVNSRDGDDKTLLMVCAEFKDKATMEAVLAHKPEINATTKSYGTTALHFLAGSLNRTDGSRENLLPMAEELVAAGADVNLRTRDGKTALKFIRVPTAALPGVPTRPLPSSGFTPVASSTVVGPPASSVDTNSIEGRLANLLREHGALDDLPDFSRIGVTRKGFSSSIAVATRDTNGLNTFSVLEMIADYYSRPSPRPFTPVGSPNAAANELPFPDPAGIQIVRPGRDVPGKKQEIPLSLIDAANNFDCAKDQWLEFGDVIEIPEREHPLSEQPVGLTIEQSNKLAECLRRLVKFIIKGRELEVSLSGYITTGDTYLSQALQNQLVQSVLRTTSDLSRVKVRRKKQGTDEEQQFTINVAAVWKREKPVSDDLWLRNGDIIEVQDKVQQAER
jgi:ankyrin repeat protein